MVVSVVLLRRSTIRQSLSAFPWGFIFVKKKQLFVFSILSNDQKPNLLRAERHGYAVSLDWDEMTGLESQFFKSWPSLCSAEELVESIRKAMGDKEMAANLERIHTLYLDREEKPVEKVEKIQILPKSEQYLGCLVGRVRVQTRRRRLAEVDRRGRSLLSIPPSRHHPRPRRCCLDLVDRDLLLLENSF